MERRLDNVIYASGLALSRSHARQIVFHQQVLVNGKVISIPSYTVKVNDIITLKDKIKAKEELMARLRDKDFQAPLWLNLNKSDLTVKIASFPTREDIKNDINDNLIIEYYSR